VAQPILLPEPQRSHVEVLGDKVHLRFPDGASDLRPIETLPDDKIDWIEQGRRATYRQLLGQGDQSLRFASHHLPVITTFTEGELFPFNSANKGIGFLPKTEYLQEYIDLFEEVHERTQNRPWKESLRERVKAASKFYFAREKIDYRVLTTLEIFERQTFQNLQRTPTASLLYTGVSPDWVSFQVNAVVEIIPQEDLRHTFIMRVRTLFESEAFHIYQPQFPYAYLFWICEVKDKSPFRVPVQPEKVQYPQSDSGLTWTPEALASISRAPSMIQKFIREIIENFARERGYTTIDKEFVKEAREQFEPKA
jgi:hypothetical protein